MKILCILLPHFPLRCEMQRNSVQRGRPVIILQSKDEASSQKTVLDFSPELTRLQCGMDLQPSLSLYGEVELIQADFPYYHRVFNGILDRIEAKSPVVEGAELGCIYVGLDGLELLYKDEADLIRSISDAISITRPLQSLAVSSFMARFGVADGKFLAYLRAAYYHCSYTSGNRGSPFCLSDLPCDVLPVDMETKAKLRAFGIHTLGQITELALGPLQAQFGPEGKRLFGLAGGHDDTPLLPRSTQETIEASATLASVTVSMQNIQAIFESLLSRTFKNLKERGIRSLTLWTRGWNGEHWEKSLQFKEPALEVNSTMRRVKLTLENYPQPGPVEQVGIEITRLGYGSGRQSSLFSDVRAKEHLLEDIKQLDFRLGKHQIFRVQEAEPWSRIPERRYTLNPLS